MSFKLKGKVWILRIINNIFHCIASADCELGVTCEAGIRAEVALISFANLLLHLTPGIRGSLPQSPLAPSCELGLNWPIRGPYYNPVIQWASSISSDPTTLSSEMIMIIQQGHPVLLTRLNSDQESIKLKWIFSWGFVEVRCVGERITI